MMAGIKGKNTRPELAIRRALHARGYRYRLHGKELPGKPDLIFPKFRAALFVNGCFWHQHDCHLFRWPKTRQDFWRDKLSRNVERDALNIERLQSAGWRTGIIWECALKGRTQIPLDDAVELFVEWLERGGREVEIQGHE